MKNVLITGISRGMGKASAYLLYKEGYNIYGTYNTTGEEEIAQIKKDIPNITLYKIDLSKRQNTLDLLKKIKNIKFFALINNAGEYAPENFKNYDMKSWDRVIELNVSAIVLLSTGLYENMEKGGAIINMASIYGAFYGGNSAVSYSASKATVVTLTKTLANIYGSKQVRAVAIAPGMIETDMSKKNGQTVLDAIADKTPLKRIGRPQEIANIVSFLISDKASYINGTTIIADGGYTCSD